MKPRSITLLIMLNLAAVITLCDGRLSAAQTSEITVSDGRQLASAIRELERRHGWIITYEDPPYEFPPEVVDVTKSVQKVVVPSRAPTLVPRGGTFINANTETLIPRIWMSSSNNGSSARSTAIRWFQTASSRSSASTRASAAHRSERAG